MLRVRYRGMWPQFTPEGGGLPDLVRRAAGCDVVCVRSDSEPVDLEVCSVFPGRLGQAVRLATGLSRRLLDPSFDYRQTRLTLEPASNATRSIWFTGENLRPPIPGAGWDMTLTFEADSWPNNSYLPLWVLHTDAFGRGDPGFLGEVSRIESLQAGRPHDRFDYRRGFACAFIRNPEPTRLAAINALRALGVVDVFGAHGGKNVPAKMEIARHYRFMVCMESDLYPGYVTEKPVEAWSAGCVPLWWGLDRDGTLNTSAIVNLADCEGLDDFVARVAKIDADASALETMWREPLLTGNYQSDGVVARLSELL